MKKLHLKISKNPEKRAKYKYSIFFKRGNVLKFTSKRNAEDYLRVFTSNVNDLIRSSFTIHRKFYELYLNHYFEIDKYNCNVIQSKNQIFLDRLEYCFKEYSEGNQSIAINSVFNLLNSIEDSVNALRLWSKDSNKYNLVNDCNSLLQMHDFLFARYTSIINDTIANKNYKTKQLKIAYKSALLKTS